MPLGMLCADRDFLQGLGQRLTLIEGDVARDLRRSLAHQFCNPAQDLGALQGRGAAPRLKCPLCGGERAVQVLARRQGQASDDRPTRRVDHVLLRPSFGLHELAVDVERQGFVGRRDCCCRVHRMVS